MSTENRDHLRAEQGFLAQQLASLPPGAQITRRSLQARLDAVQARISQLPAGRQLSRVLLTFSGRPVLGSHGINADFGTQAVGRFSDAVAAVAAALTAPLASMGPIPNRDQNQLLIVGTAKGSFGFELEESGGLVEDTGVSQALVQTQLLLDTSVGRDYEALADALNGLGSRAVDKVRSFVTLLADRDAVCSLQYGQRTFRFSDRGQVQLSMDRLSTSNVHERNVTFEGEFLGVLPVSRSFEFRVSDGSIVKGRIGPAIADPDALNALVRQRTAVQFVEIAIGSGRPRFMLMHEPSLRTIESSARPAGTTDRGDPQE